MSNAIESALQKRARIDQYVLRHPEANRTEISRALGIPETTVRRLVSMRLPTSGTRPPEPPPRVGARSTPTGCELVSENPCTLDDLLRACQVDLTVWRVNNHVLNKWEVGTKFDGKVVRTPLYQIKAWLERIPGLDEANALREVIEEIRSGESPVPVKASFSEKPAILDPRDTTLLEVSLADLHFDRLTWGNESGENWDCNISRKTALDAVDALLDISRPFPVTRILYVAGNDFFTSDTPGDTTTAGTPQVVDGRWQKSFKLGIRLQVEIIERLRDRAPVDIMVVPGNHDSTKMFYLGCILEAIYGQTGDVRVLNSPSIRKYYRWGTVLLGYAHGHTEKHGALPLIMAGEVPVEWAATTHREFHVGHYHHKKETQFHAGTEVGPVRVRILPSLTATDAWHARQGYVGAKKATEIYLWSKLRGYVGHFSWSPPSTAESDVTVTSS